MATTNPTRYPEVEVHLIGAGGNAMLIIGRVNRALRDNGVTNTEITEFTTEAMSGDYQNVLRTVMRWVTVC